MTKLTTDRIPSMKPKAKPKKLGLITTKKRANVTYRFQNETIDRLNKLLDRAHQAINYKITRTDILEALVLDAANNHTNTYIKNMLLALGKG
jgi:uncharacterized membrane protein